MIKVATGSLQLFFAEICEEYTKGSEEDGKDKGYS